VRQTDLVRLVASEPEHPRRVDVERHLAECPLCRARFSQHEALWRTLGEWAPDLPKAELITGIELKLRGAQPALRLFWFRQVTRIAAAVLIGVGAGHGAARIWLPEQPSPSSVAGAAHQKAATDALGIEYLEEASPAGLYAALSDLLPEPDLEEDHS
jgi:predicted anti-sigma-YlaC factor YlaD